MFIETTIGRVDHKQKGDYVVSDKNAWFTVPPNPKLPELKPGDPITLIFYGDWTPFYKQLFGARTIKGSCPEDYETGPVYYDARSQFDFFTKFAPSIISALETLLYSSDVPSDFMQPATRHTP